MAYSHISRLSIEQIHVLPEALTTKEACGVLGMQPNTLQRWVREGRIPASKMGNRLMFSKATICKLAGITDKEGGLLNTKDMKPAALTATKQNGAAGINQDGSAAYVHDNTVVSEDVFKVRDKGGAVIATDQRTNVDQFCAGTEPAKNGLEERLDMVVAQLSVITVELHELVEVIKWAR